MAVYKIVCCPYCSKWQLSIGRKSHRCVYCGRRMNLEKTKVWLSSSNVDLVRSVLSKLQVLETRRPDVINRLICKCLADYKAMTTNDFIE